MTAADLLHDDGNLRLRVHERPEAPNDRVLISCTGIGHGLGGIDVQRDEFFASSDGYRTTVFMRDQNRSWGNQVDWAALRETLEPIVDGREVDVIGNSMGGFNAVLVAASIPVRTVLALSPQFSVKPEITPWETRWREYVDRIEDWRIESLEGRFMDRSRYFVISGVGNPYDARHLALFPQSPNVTSIDLRGFFHDMTLQLKNLGLMGDVLRLAFAQKLSADWMESAVRKARLSRQ